MAKSGNFYKCSKKLQKMCVGLDWKRVWCEERHCKNCQHWHWLTCLGLMVMLRFGLREILHHSLLLTKIQCQRSINSSASIMIVQLPWKGVDKLIRIVDYRSVSSQSQPILLHDRQFSSCQSIIVGWWRLKCRNWVKPADPIDEQRLQPNFSEHIESPGLRPSPPLGAGK